MIVERPNAKYRRVYAIVRFDNPVNRDQPEDSIAVVKVFSSKENAEVETARLNKINSEKRCTYAMYITRMPSIH